MSVLCKLCPAEWTHTVMPLMWFKLLPWINRCESWSACFKSHLTLIYTIFMGEQALIKQDKVEWNRWRVRGAKGRFNSLPPSVVCWYLLQTVWNQIRPDKTSGLIWIQTVWHSDGIPERIFRKCWFWNKSADDKRTWTISEGAKSWPRNSSLDKLTLSLPCTTEVVFCCCILKVPIANYVNLDQTAPYWAVWSGPILFACK